MSVIDDLQAYSNTNIKNLEGSASDNYKLLTSAISKAHSKGLSFVDLESWMRKQSFFSKLVPGESSGRSNSGFELDAPDTGLYHSKLTTKSGRDKALFWFVKNGKLYFYVDTHQPKPHWNFRNKLNAKEPYQRVKEYRKLVK